VKKAIDKWFSGNERRLGIRVIESPQFGGRFMPHRLANGCARVPPEGVEVDRCWELELNSKTWGYLVVSDCDGGGVIVYDLDVRPVVELPGMRDGYTRAVTALASYYLGYIQGREDA